MKRRDWIALFAVLTICVLWFIFSHSLKSITESAQQSMGLLEILKQILDPYGHFQTEIIHKLLRKAAHVVEFSALGDCVGGFTINLGWLQQRRYISLPMLITLAAAVCDEWIQYFTGRGSLVTDVMLDYSGALIGLLLSTGIAWWRCRCVHRKQERSL